MSADLEVSGRAPAGHPDHPRLRRGAGDRAQDRQRAGARLPGGAPRGRWSPRMARPTGPPSWPARRAPIRFSSCPAAARLRHSTRRSGGRRATILAFSDANSYWRPDALRRLVDRFADGRVGYACGQVRFEGGEGGNQEGLYWRYEMAVRSLETRLGGITAGNGGYLRGPPRGLHRARSRVAARTSASPSSSPSGAGAPSTSPRRSPRRRWRPRSRASSAASAG